jgi:hypothetical protein
MERTLTINEKNGSLELSGHNARFTVEAPCGSFRARIRIDEPTTVTFQLDGQVRDTAHYESLSAYLTR